MEVKHSGKSMEQRIHDRLKPSAGENCGDVQVTKGTGPTRVITTIHHSGHQQHGEHLDVCTKPTPKERHATAPAPAPRAYDAESGK
jgi:hypothetical protein